MIYAVYIYFYSDMHFLILRPPIYMRVVHVESTYPDDQLASLDKALLSLFHSSSSPSHASNTDLNSILATASVTPSTTGGVGRVRDGDGGEVEMLYTECRAYALQLLTLSLARPPDRLTSGIYTHTVMTSRILYLS